MPFANPSRAISTFVWLLTLSYLYLELTTDERAMGVFILPIVVGLQIDSRRSIPASRTRDPVLDSPWFWVHVSSLLFAYASFALAGVLGLTYMLQFKEIKKKHLGYFYTRLPSLQILDAMNSRAVDRRLAVPDRRRRRRRGLDGAGARAWRPTTRNLQAMSLNDPKIFVALLTWAVYSFAVFARRDDGLERPARGVAVGGRVRHRAAELPADQLLRDDEPHVSD